MLGRVPLGRAFALLSLLLLVGLAGCTRDRPLVTPQPWSTPTTPVAGEPTTAPLLLTPSTGEQPSQPPTPVGQGAAPAPTNSNNPSAPVDLSNTTTYTVQAGDTLASIARRFNTDVATLMRLNGLTSDTILVNQVLRVPGTAAPTSPPLASGQRTYTVQAGDTLASIALAFGVDIQELIRINNIADPDTIYVGQVLTIPGGGDSVQAAGVGEGRTYTVQPGDTLRSIAVRFGLTVQDLLAVNNIPDPDNIHPGDVIRIP